MVRLALALALLAIGCDCGGSRAGGGVEPPAPRPAEAPTPEAPTPAAGDGTPASSAPEEARFVEARRQMVDRQLAARDITDPRVLAAMGRVPRHLFVPEVERREAYADYPLPIGHEQTISQPYVVAYMSQALGLEGDERVLEIGTGSGYQAAVLAELCREVYTIEIVPELAASARALLAELGYRNVQVRAGDGYRGWPEAAPFDAVIVTAAPDHVPEPLVAQLREGGRMIVPVGAVDQDLVLIERGPRGVVQRRVMPVRFVPMTGEAERRR